MKVSIGLAGEFKIAVIDKQGNKKTDTEWQRNLITDAGLDFLCGGGDDMDSWLQVGVGNSLPSNTDKALDSVLAEVQPDRISKSYKRDSLANTYRLMKQSVFLFRTGVANSNIAEIGLSTVKSGAVNTRALIKDSSGVPTTINVLDGEVLEITYRIYAVYSTLDVIGTVVDTDSGDTYDTIMRPSVVGSEDFWTWASCVSKAFTAIGYSTGMAGMNDVYIGSSPITGISTSAEKWLKKNLKKNALARSAYVAGTYKRTATINLDVTEMNDWPVDGVCSVAFGTSLGCWQVQYTNTVTGKGIIKTAKHKLSLPFEFSVSRYEEELG